MTETPGQAGIHEMANFRQTQNGKLPIIVNREGATMTSYESGRKTRSEAGFTLIDLLFVISLIGLLSTLAIPGLMRARGAAQSASALGTIKVVNSAQLSFAITCGLGFYSPTSRRWVSFRPGRSTRSSHRRCRAVRRSSRAATCSAWRAVGLAGAPAFVQRPGRWRRQRPATRWSADPLDTAPPARYLGSNADGVIWEDTASLHAHDAGIGIAGVGNSDQGKGAGRASFASLFVWYR